MGATIGSIPRVVLGPKSGPGEGPPLCVASSRSAMVRLAPVVAALSARGARPRVAGLTRDLDLHVPPNTLACFGRSVDEIAADVEDAVCELRPRVALLCGDNDATVACALVVARHGIPIARVGAGLRCGDPASGDEVNRIVLDAMADRLYVDGADAGQTLVREGVAPASVVTIGSTLRDVVERWHDAAREQALWRRLGQRPRDYVLAALQRPERLAGDARLAHVVEGLCALAVRVPLVLCLHPATLARLELSGGRRKLVAAGADFTDPLPYLEFLSLLLGAGSVLTDSAGVQEETTILGVPCFTFDHVSERTLTLTHGTNVLLGDDPEDLVHVATGTRRDDPAPIPGWDGGAARRVSDDLRLLEAA